METIIADTGPIVAFFDKREKHHGWVKSCFEKLSEPLMTCEAVLVESSFLLHRRGSGLSLPFQLVQREMLTINFSLKQNWKEVEKLSHHYRDTPMSLADACLVRMSELHPQSTVFTLDRDFLHYRRLRHRQIPLLAPFV